MVDPTDVGAAAKSLAKHALGPPDAALARGAAQAQHAVQFSARAMEAAGAVLARSLAEDDSYERMDVTDLVTPSAEGMSAHLIVPRTYRETHDVWGPGGFQIGSALGIENWAFREATNIIFDPIGIALSLTPLGVGNITKLGRAARLTSMMRAGAKVGAKGEDVVNATMHVLEVASKVRGKYTPEALIELSRKNPGALKRVLLDAVKSGEVAAEDAKLISAIRRDAKSLATVIDEGRKIGQATIPKSLVLQGTLRERMFLKQAAPIPGLMWQKPYNPLREPGKFTLQMLGLKYRDEMLYIPMARSGLEGLDKVGLYKRGIAGVPKPTSEERIGPVIDELESLRAKVQNAGVRETSLADWDYANTTLTALNGSPSQRQYHLILQDPMSDQSLEAAYRLRHGLVDSTKVDKTSEAFEIFAAKYHDSRAEVVRDIEKSVMKQREQHINTVIDQYRGRAATYGLTEGDLAAREQQIRRIADLMSLEQMRYDVLTPAHGLAARVTLGTFLSQQIVAGGREMVKAAYPTEWAAQFATRKFLGIPIQKYTMGRNLQAEIAQIPALFAENPELFYIRDGKLFLEKGLTEKELLGGSSRLEELRKAKGHLRPGGGIAGSEQGHHFVADFLASSIKDPDGKSIVRSLLETEGLHQDVTAMSLRMRDSLVATGQNMLRNEGLLFGTVESYFPRVVSLTQRGIDELKKRGLKTDQYFERLMAGDLGDESRAFQLLVRGPTQAGLKGKQYKVSFQEARRLTEKAALAMEKRGWVKFERDALTRYGRYMDSANKNIALAAALRTFTSETLASHMLPKLGRAEDVRAFLGSLADGLEDDTIKGLKWAVESQPDAKVRNLYDEIDLRPRYARGFEEPAFLHSATQEKVIRGELNSEGARIAESQRRLGAKLHGKTEFVDAKGQKIQLIDVETKEPVPFQDEWAEQMSIPKSVRGQVVGREKYRKALAPNNLRKKLKPLVAAEQREVNKMLRTLRDERRAFLKRKLAPDERTQLPNRVWVLKPISGDVRELMNLYESTNLGGTLTDFADVYKRLNWTSKSVVLLGDVLHYNTLTLRQMATGGPGNYLRLLMDPEGKWLPGVREGMFAPESMRAFAQTDEGMRLRRAAAIKTGVGALAGGLIGSLRAEDPADIATASIVGGLYGLAIGAAKLNAQYAKRVALNPDQLDTLYWMAVGGGWTGRPDDRAIGWINKSLRNVVDDVRRAGKEGFWIDPADGARHLLDSWDQAMWETLHNGGKHFAFGRMWATHMPKLQSSEKYSEGAIKATFEQRRAAGVLQAGMTYEKFLKSQRHEMHRELSAQIMAVVNSAFGGQAFRALLDDPQWAIRARQIMLSPDWNTSRVSLSAMMLANSHPVTRTLLGGSVGAMWQYAEDGFDMDHAPVRGMVLGSLLGSGLSTRSLGGLGKGIEKLGGVVFPRSARFGTPLSLGAFATQINKRLFTKGDVLAKESRNAAAALLLGGFTVGNAINIAFTGKPMWDNEEGRRLSVALPGRDDRGRTRYMNLAKYLPLEETLQFASISDADRYPIPVASRLASKLTVPGRLTLQVGANLRMLSTTNGLGPILTGRESPFDIGFKAVEMLVDSTTPIILQGAFENVADAIIPGRSRTTADEALMRFLGLPIRKGRGDTPTLRGALARPPGGGISPPRFGGVPSIGRNL